MLRNYGMLGQSAMDNQLVNDCIEQNTGPDRRIVSQIQGRESLERFQDHLLRSTRPERHVQEDYEDGEQATKQRSRYRMNLMQYGNELGDQEQAYKPEIVNDPIPRRTWEENPAELFKKDKRANKLYTRSTTAQKENILQFPEHEKGYKYSDAFDYIPLEVRNINKIDLDIKEIPLYSRSAVKKSSLDYRDQVEDLKSVFTDPNSVKRKRKGPKISTSFLREHVDGQPVDTDVNEIYQSIAKKKKVVPRLPQEITPEGDNMTVQNAGWKRHKPKNIGFVNPGIVTDSDSYLELAETVHNIEKVIKKGANRPKLGFRNVVATAILVEIQDFKKKRSKNVSRSGYVPDVDWDNIEDETGVANPTKDDHYVKKISNAMVMNVRKEDALPDLLQVTSGFKKAFKPNLVHARNFAVEVFGDDTETMTTTKKLGVSKKGNLSLTGGTGYDTTDTLEIEDQVGSRKKNVKLGNIAIDDKIDDESGIVGININREKNKKTRVNRAIRVGTVSIDADPYNQTAKSPMHPSQFKKKIARSAKLGEYARARTDISNADRDTS